MRFLSQIIILFGIMNGNLAVARVSPSLETSSDAQFPAEKESEIPLAFKGGQNFPLSIDANQGIVCDHKKNMCTASGNVLATYGDYTLTCDHLTAHFRTETTENTPQTLWQIEVQGKVRIVSKDQSQVIEGDQGTYNLETQRAIMKGTHLKLIINDLSVTALDTLEFWGAESMAVARGKALMTRDGKVMKADHLKAYFFQDALQKNSLQRLEGIKDVTIATASEIAQGDWGSYDTETEKAVLTGNVKIVRKEGVMEGSRAEVDLKTGISSMGDSSSNTRNPNRVRVLMLPRASKSS